MLSPSTFEKRKRVKFVPRVSSRKGDRGLICNCRSGLICNSTYYSLFLLANAISKPKISIAIFIISRKYVLLESRRSRDLSTSYNKLSG